MCVNLLNLNDCENLHRFVDEGIFRDGDGIDDGGAVAVLCGVRFLCLLLLAYSGVFFYTLMASESLVCGVTYLKGSVKFFQIELRHM